MNSYVLTCCSTADFPREYFVDRHIPFACFSYELNGVSHSDDLYLSTTPQEFYGALKAGGRSVTSQISVGAYVTFWESFLREGMDVLHVTLSSGVTGTYNSACLAAEQLSHRYPDRTIRVLDSLCASSGFGLLVDYMADMRDAGASLEEVYAWGLEHRRNLQSWFFVTDLDCLKRGGRVSATSALLANALKICPVLTIDAEGRLVPMEKIRTKKKAVSALAEKMELLADGGSAYAGKCCISHSNCYEDACAVRDLVERRMPQLSGGIQIHDIGTVIGSHTGPGTVALFFMGEPRA